MIIENGKKILWWECPKCGYIQNTPITCDKCKEISLKPIKEGKVVTK